MILLIILIYFIIGFFIAGWEIYQDQKHWHILNGWLDFVLGIGAFALLWPFVLLEEYRLKKEYD